MKIAIVGAGLAGVAAAWELAQHASVTLFDPKGIGGGASGIAPGLLHPYGGFYARRSWRATEGMEATHRLLQHVPQAVDTHGILRLATTEVQADAFRKTTQSPDVEWIPNALAGYDGILIRSGVTIRIQPYLEGLVAKSQATLIMRGIQTLDELDSFDRVVCATGPSNTLVHDPELNGVKGQILEIGWPATVPPPSMSIIGKKYLVMSADRTTCLVGATFERNAPDAAPHMEIARSQLLPPVCELYPELANMPIIRCRAAIRATTADHHPRLKKISERVWSLRGLGSKGLLYHALFARELAACMLS